MLNFVKNTTVILLILILASCSSDGSKRYTGPGLNKAGFDNTGMCEDEEIQPDSKEALPCLIKPPRYPRDAAINRIMGQVVFSFTINESGRPEDIKIIEAEPAGVFETVAMNAITQWVFKPRKVDGIVVKQHDMTYTMVFNVQ